jgi:hypothetical protein
MAKQWRIGNHMAKQGLLVNSNSLLYSCGCFVSGIISDKLLVPRNLKPRQRLQSNTMLWTVQSSELCNLGTPSQSLRSIMTPQRTHSASARAKPKKATSQLSSSTSSTRTSSLVKQLSKRVLKKNSLKFS